MANLVGNEGFESGTGTDADDWNEFGDCGREWWAAGSGAQGFALWGWITSSWGGAWQDVNDQTGGLWYALSVQAKAESNFYANSVYVKVEWLDTNDVEISESGFELASRLSTSWSQYQVMVCSPPGTDKARIVIGGGDYNSPGDSQQACMFDDVSLTITNSDESDAVLVSMGCDDMGRPVFSWSNVVGRWETVWRSSHLDYWQSAYPPQSVDATGTARWVDANAGQYDQAMFRVERSGMLIPGSHVQCTAAGTTGVSYIRFLPSNFSTEGTNPLVIGLSPNGWGMEMVDAFRSSAEKFGWIVVGCNTIKNGYDPLHDLRFMEILHDVRATIPYDKKRLYLAGFSGGAARSYGYAREFWNEFAGVIGFGGWIGDYDDYNVFPDRLALARISGSNDAGALAWEDIDRSYFTQTAVRVQDFYFDGHHQIAPPFHVDRALTWLEQDHVNFGYAYVSNAAVEQAAALLAELWDATRVGDYSNAAIDAAYLLTDKSYFCEAQEAETVLLDVFSDSAKQIQVCWPPDPSNKKAEDAWVLLSRSLIYIDGYPEREKAYLEAAYKRDPTNGFVCARLVHYLLQGQLLSTQYIARATALADIATNSSPNLWWTYYARGEVAAATGDYVTAIDLTSAGWDLIDEIPLHPGQSLCSSAITNYNWLKDQ